MQSPSEPLPVVALIRDLMFVGKVTGTARATGSAVAVVREPDKVAAVAGRLLLVDLSLPGAVEAAVAWKQAHARPAIGFVAHVDTETIQRAREAGIDHVMARSAFTAQLESLLKSG